MNMTQRSHRSLFLLLIMPALTYCGTTRAKTKPSPVYASHRPWAMLGAKIYAVADGQKVKTVTPGGPAAGAGILPGDIILSINGRRALDTRDFIRYVRLLRPGSTCTIRYTRDLNMPATATAVLQKYPQDQQLMLMARLALRALDTRRAQELLQKLKGMYPSSPLAKKAGGMLGKTLLR